MNQNNLAEPLDFNLTCPIPIADYPRVTLAHGGGGRLMRDLIQKMFLSAFNNPYLNQLTDGASLAMTGAKLAFTTDSYVVRPIFFPGGDIGSLAIHGTINDLVMCGAKPLYLSVGLILEEGLPMTDLWRVINSMSSAAKLANVQIVTGDTKVVDQGKGDGIYINTSGIGQLYKDPIGPHLVKPGDGLILSGDIGRHGIAIMAVREGLEFESKIESDSASLAAVVDDLMTSGIEIHCMRDLTRGGLASGVIEIAQSSKSQINLVEDAIPVREDVQGACEILGLDPLYVANEGRFVVFAPKSEIDRTLDIMRRHELAKESALIGQVRTGTGGLVSLKTKIGTSRIVDLLSGEQLPRIC